MIVTEGPRDAQKWTVEQLGLAPYVDVLVTSNEVGLAKDAGLFEEVSERCGIRKEDVVPAKAVCCLMGGMSIGSEGWGGKWRVCVAGKLINGDWILAARW